MIAVSDTIKDTSYQAIKELKKKNLEIVMITGDNKIVAETIGNKLGIDKVISEVLPQDKEKEVTKLQQAGKKVAFVGDGINDSPAISKADVGIAIGSGTDIAIESADVVLIKNNLYDVNTAISLSRATIRNIKMNLFWAFFYNAIGIPVACGIFYPIFNLKLNPMIGAAAMSFRAKNDDLKLEEENVKMEKTIMIEGMQCNHCKMSVEKALGKIDGITEVEVDLEQKMAKIKTNKDIDDSVIKSSIEEEGYEVKEIK